MSTQPVPDPAPEQRFLLNRDGPGTITYRLATLLLLGGVVWCLVRLSGQISSLTESREAAIKSAFSLPGNTWRREYVFDGKSMVAIMEFRDDGSIFQEGSGNAKFRILSGDEVWIDPRPEERRDGEKRVFSGGLFGWPYPDGSRDDNWTVATAGDNLVLRRKRPPNDTITLLRVRKPDEQITQILQTLQRVQNEFVVQGIARRSENEAIRREIQLLREAEKKRGEEGKK